MKKHGIKSIYYFWLDWRFRAKIISTLLNVTVCSIAALLVANYITNVRQATEQIGSNFLILGNQTLMRTAQKVAEEVRVLETLARTPSIVAAANEANVARADWTPELIAAQDAAWIDQAAGIEPTVNEIAGNQISAYLIDFQKANPEEAELFITDIKGLNIAMTGRTSDFLQADEDWWQAAFASGYGFTYFGPVEYDESSKTFAMKIGVPIRNPETNEAIGALRGTLNISMIISTLADVTIGTTSDVVLIDSEGIVLYTRAPGYFMKPAPDSILALFESEQDGWTQGTGMNGSPVIMAYSSLRGPLGQSLGWHILITQSQTEAKQGVVSSLLASLLAAILVAGAASVLSTIVMSRSIVAPLRILTEMAKELSTGNITSEVSDQTTDMLRLRKDEIGAIGRAFDRLNVYFRGAAAASTAIADNDLTIEVTPNSERDVLGIAFAKMVSGLRYVIGQVTKNAEALSSASSQLANATEGSGEATSQIALTMKEVALGAIQQSDAVSKTSGTLAQMRRILDDVARGAQEQARAISKASTATMQIAGAIQQVASNARSGAQGAAEAALTARNGARTVESTIASMQTITTKVNLSAEKIREMDQHSEKIDTIVETIDELASQTNLLALNAAIEAARVEAKGKMSLERILQQHMLGAASLVAGFLSAGHELHSEDLVMLARQARVEDFFISDSDGVIVAASDPNSLGFRFSEDTRHQSSVFRPLLDQQEGIVIQPLMPREQDGKTYVYVGVSRRDCPGIVQAGIAGDVVERLSNYSHGFAVIADEIRKLSEHARSSTKEIAVIIRAIQKTATEAGVVMADGACAVENGSAHAREAGEALSAILQAAEAVNYQVGEIAAAVQQIDASSNNLASVMETVSAVVEENTAATEEMVASSNEVTETIENIASISEENSAAAEEVSASAEELSDRIAEVSKSAEALFGMAADLQALINQFKL